MQRETYSDASVIEAARYFTEEYRHRKTQNAANQAEHRQKYFQHNSCDWPLDTSSQ